MEYLYSYYIRLFPNIGYDIFYHIMNFIPTIKENLMYFTMDSLMFNLATYPSIGNVGLFSYFVHFGLGQKVEKVKFLHFIRIQIFISSMKGGKRSSIRLDRSDPLLRIVEK